MQYSSVLSALKYLGFVIAAATTTWGLTHETSTKDASGKKRLTSAGHVALALTLASAMMSMVAYGLEGVIKEGDRFRAEQARRTSDARAQQEAAQRRRDAAEDRRRDEDREQRLQLTAALAEDRERLERFEQTQQLLLAAQPLRVLSFTISFRGLSDAQRKGVRDGVESVDYMTDPEHGNLDNLSSATIANYRREIARSEILYPLLQSIGQGGKDAILIIDLDGTGSVVLPLGATTAEQFSGYVEQVDALAARTAGDPIYHVAGIDGPAWHNAGKCPPLTLTAAGDGRYVEVTGWISAACFSTLTQAAANEFASAALPPRLRAVLVSGYGKLPLIPTNVLDLQYPFELCWKDAIEPAGPLELVITLTPNLQPSAAKTYRLRKSGSWMDFRYRSTTLEEEAAEEFGSCQPFGVAARGGP